MIVPGWEAGDEDLDDGRDYFQFIVDQWTQGKLCTDPYPLYSIDRLPPCPNSLWYSKPILVVIKALDFSGADFFPAMLQDSQRAKLFGARTAGAGGFIDRISFRNPFGLVSIQFTASIAKRKNNSPFENLGVEHDICYEITPDDLQNGHQGYVSVLQDAVEAVLVTEQL